MANPSDNHPVETTASSRESPATEGAGNAGAPGDRQPKTKRPTPAEKAENSIRPRRPRTARRESSNASLQAPAPQNPTAAPESSTAHPGSDPWTVPPSVRDRFTQEGRRFYFPDGAQAFRDHGRKLTTASENAELIHSLVEIAKARGWDTVVVQGTEKFREEAWRQARLEGLAVRGYQPSAPERVLVSRALARRQEAREEQTPNPPTDAVTPASPERSGRAKAEPSSAKITGRLVDHGRDTYNFDPHEEISYFVSLQTPEGKRTFWGKDLQRAWEQSLSKPKIGDEVAIRVTGKDKVTVHRRERDREGAVVTEKPLDTHRNRWVIETEEFLEAREAAAAVIRDPKIEPKVAVKAHPQLAGTYLNLHAAEIAAKVLPDPQDQKTFVTLVRHALADAIERGAPLQPVRLRERVQVRSAEPQEREAQAPARA